eukprot:SAG22_NODE_4256_length_1325_cov_1.586460_3_plen_143_part_01
MTLYFAFLHPVPNQPSTAAAAAALYERRPPIFREQINVSIVGRGHRLGRMLLDQQRDVGLDPLRLEELRPGRVVLVRALEEGEHFCLGERPDPHQRLQPVLGPLRPRHSAVAVGSGGCEHVCTDLGHRLQRRRPVQRLEQQGD